MAENLSFFKTLREGMVKEIEEDVKLTRSKIGKTALVPEVMRVMGKVPRHEFVPLNLKSHAYENRPLPIGYGQTISQPYIVALMTDLLEPAPGQKVLEIGTGSGYQAAVLAELVGRVYSIEIIPELAREAQARIKRLGYGNIEIRQGDGYYGWEDQAPFDGIIVTAAGSHIPPPLVQQLKPGGKMVIPVGGSFMTQQLVVVEKLSDGKVRSRQVLPVAFVPLTGGH
ncbi:MAG TPA: protein-L-isoaspartate(D-aspartate) O-methyltransferase [Syntrophobacteraceae bacterium]|nr:protein-L-isoaspartate(D-aspartate) O-methyltransferase [Syntrophobacteraceae bacterium]